MILKRTLRVENQNLKRCKIDPEIDYGSQKGEVIVYRKRQRASVDQPCREPEDVASSAGSLTSKESRLGSEQSKSSRGRVRVVPSRFNDSIVDAWNTRRHKVESKESSHDDDKRVMKKVKGGHYKRAENGSSKFNLSKGSKLFPRKDNGDSSEVDFDDWGGEKDANIRMSRLSSSDDANSFSVRVKEQFYAESGMLENPAAMKKGVYKPEDFAVGDLVWAKCGKRFPAWPAKVIDPVSQAPDAVLKHCVPGSLCVMFFGHSKDGTQRDYGWVRQGMVFPFAEYMDKFQDQTNFYNNKPSDFKEALEEAVLAENGVEGNCGAAEISCPDSSATTSDQENAPAYRLQSSCPVDISTCDGCGTVMPLKSLKRTKGSQPEELLCKHYAKVLRKFPYSSVIFGQREMNPNCIFFKMRKSNHNQYCGICKIPWHSSDGGD